MTPIPPACAIDMAILLSVTVSIAELSSGMLSAIERVTRVVVSAVEGKTLEAPGTNKTSSKVRASRISICILRGMCVWRFAIAWNAGG
jgi:hypothetical protein